MEPSIVMEVRPRVQACHVVLSSPQSGAAVQLTVRPSEMSTEWFLGDKTVQRQTVSLPLNLNIKLQPCTLSALVQNEKCVSFRVQTEPGSSLSGSFSTQVIFTENCFIPKVFPQIVIPTGQSCHIKCACCQNSLLLKDAVNFKRVLPLPSQSCDFGDFFCHKHDDNPSAKNEGNLNCDPGELDCLYSSSTIQVHRSLLESKDTVMRCKRCLAWIGTCEGNRACLWNCTMVVTVVGPGNGHALGSHPAHDFVDIVKEMISNSVAVACRLLLEVKVSTTQVQYLLLWVVDRELLLLTSNVNKTELVRHTASKVSFSLQKVKSDLVSLWLNDIRVNSMEIALPIFIHGVRLLSATSQFIPVINRHTQDGFLLAYVCSDFINW